MKRRDFLAASCVAGTAPLSSLAAGQEPAAGAEKQYLELRLYELEAGDKAKAFGRFLKGAAIPALNRLGIGPVGVFKFTEGDSPNLYVLLPHKTLESVATVNTRLLEDEEFLKAGADILDAPISDKAYLRMESSLSLAFDKCPTVETPSKKDSRIFQLRIYESHSAKKAKMKVHMFDHGGELDLFRKTGMPPVFFGETLVGAIMPNLTYMLGFDDADAKDAGWKAFLASDQWNKLKKLPIYADTVSRITNIMLLPGPGSQI